MLPPSNGPCSKITRRQVPDSLILSVAFFRGEASGFVLSFSDNVSGVQTEKTTKK